MSSVVAFIHQLKLEVIRLAVAFPSGSACQRSLFGLLCLLPAFLANVGNASASEADQKLRSVAFWYADAPPVSELSQFDWVVLEPGHVQAADIALLRGQGSLPFAYLSVGEFSGDAAALAGASLQSGASPVRNEAWDSQVMPLSSKAWRDHLLQRAHEFRAAGYAGLFLDTLDSFQLLPANQREAERLALRDFLAELKRREPELKLFFNRGFEVLPELPGVAAAVAVESIHAGWDPENKAYRPVSDTDREWLEGHLKPLRDQNIPLVAIDYLPPERRDDARQLAARLRSEGFIPYVTVPNLDQLGISSIEVQPRRIAMIYDPREGDMYLNAGHMYLAGLLEYLGYRVDYWTPDQLPERPLSGLYAGVVTWMTSGSPVEARAFNQWLVARADEHVPIAFFGGLPIENDSVLRRFGLRRTSTPLSGKAEIAEHDKALLGSFEAPLVMRTRDVPPLTTLPGGPKALLALQDDQKRLFTPAVLGDWGGLVLSPYVIEEGPDQRRWIVDPFAFLQQALRLPPIPSLDATTENGRRIATVHLDGDGFVSRAETPGSPYSGELVLNEFIKPYPFLTSVSVIEGEIGPRGMYPYLADELEPVARKIFAEKKVEVATHTFSHPFFWQPEKAAKREGFNPEYGFMMAIPGYKKLDFTREIVGSTAYINQRLTTPAKPVKMVFWSGDAMPDEATVKLAYDAGLSNVNGGTTALTNAHPSMTGLSPLLRPTSGGLHYYAPIINENVYTNLWRGPYYGFRGVMETFALTDKPRRLRGLNLYYHFYSGTKQASIRVMHEIYRAMQAEQPISLWMSDYVTRMHGIHQGSLARQEDGSWQIRALDGLRTVRLDPRLGWPDLTRSSGIAGVRDLPQGRYVHLAGDMAVLALRDSRDPRPALEEANLPLLDWHYLDDHRVRFSFQGNMPLTFAVRAQGTCAVEIAGKQYAGTRESDLWRFKLPMERVLDAQLFCR
ncbi:bifunctional glycoside hydrolase 114/ polysaccharide deacetylase family protein [Pseudomonas seleniipraecipitans]|uniref:Bifunctional glycoside hydrolase 114/ polysaccharide deacetylase family protein n=1 Tax=Phytopseudomonas seleniipraecipitans TaxID=640205 RepID=A0ABY5JI08_9GAMM|nr:bifunctional glycoside hydrolase 114/ polysaccharide deacetylase family protein [Pseudomonas seleniipraecipitans]UUD66040.1 bifunctional glycoside hydrolase 114/ polysaccharide deacetylase family protein [Pseudomonas seleniipraecipitans]